MKQCYVVGFLFNQDRTEVVLIRKNHPEWQKGKLNGIGGKIKEEESADDAMIREFEEEASLLVNDWRLFLVLDCKKAIVNFYEAAGDLFKVVAGTEEQILIVELIDLPFMTDIIPNLRWIVPMALDKDKVGGTVFDNSDFE